MDFTTSGEKSLNEMLSIVDVASHLSILLIYGGPVVMMDAFLSDEKRFSSENCKIENVDKFIRFQRYEL